MFVNKNYSIITAIAIIFSTMAIKALTPEELANYEAIRGALKARDYNQNSVQIGSDIACIEKHIKEQEELKNNWQMSVAPFFFKLFGGGFGLTAGVGALATTAGALGTMAMIGPAAYKDVLWWGYSMAIPEKLGLISYNEALWKDAQSRFHGNRQRHKPLIEGSFYLAGIGVLAPALGTVSAISAGISRYLFNKAARYKNEIERLEKEIEEDKAHIEELKTKLPAKDTQ